MLIRHLHFFTTLARVKHFARTAEVCNVTQPTLSLAIRKLEDHLGIPLVLRGHRYVGLTPEGEKALVWARQILNDFESMREEIASVKGGLSGVLRLGVVPAAMPAIAFLTAPFSSAHPEVVIDIQSLTSRTIQRGLDAFDLDAGVTYLESEPPENVRSLPLYDERYVFVTQKGKPCARANAIAWAEAAQEKLCLLSVDMQNRRILDRLAQSIGVTISPSIVCNSFLDVSAHLRCADYASIVPHTFFNVFGAAPDLVGLDLIEPTHTQAIGLVVADRDPPSPIVAALLRSCRHSRFGDGLVAGASAH